MLNKLRLRLRALFFKPKMEDELQAELQFHLEREIEENIARGMTPEDAHYAAIRSFGGVERVKEESRDVRGVLWVPKMLSAQLYARTYPYRWTQLRLVFVNLANSVYLPLGQTALHRIGPSFRDNPVGLFRISNLVVSVLFLRLVLLSAHNRDRLDTNYIKLPADIGDEGHRPQGLRRSDPFFQIRLFVVWESSDRVIDAVWNCYSSGNNFSKFFEDALRKVQSRGRDIRGVYCRSFVPRKDFARASGER